MTRLISLAEVKKHRDKDSVWMVIHNDVYDVTSFLEEHPGGEDSLLEVAGQEATQPFEDVGHSDDARELLKKYKIGTVPPEELECKPCCPHIPKTEKAEKTWRTYDGSPSSRPAAVKSEYKLPCTPRSEPRVQAITVPRESSRGRPRPRGPPCESSSNLKWAVIALAGALVLGIVLKKYLSK